MGRKLMYGEALFAHKKGDTKKLLFIAGYDYKKKICTEVELFPDDSIVFMIVDLKTGRNSFRKFEDIVIDERHLIDTLIC